MEASTTEQTTCYRHPGRETGVSCSSCGRPICPDCMTPTPVGMRCPECSRQRTQVRTAQSIRGEPRATYVLIGLNVLAFLGLVFGGGGFDGGGRLFDDGALNGFAVADGEWWRIVTAGFLHAGPIHILFNMYFLYFLGSLLEPAIGTVRFLTVYFVSLIGGSLGAILLSHDVNTVGASGAVFGLMGAGILAMRARGIDPMQSGLGLVLLINLGITFVIPNISIGGHLGGLAAGFVAGYLLFDVAERKRSLRTPLLAVCIGLGVAAFVGTVLAANAAVGV